MDLYGSLAADDGASMTQLLILVPTECELDQLRPQIAPILNDLNGAFEVCGFGPIASGIRTTRLLARHTPDSVILVGIAGALKPQLEIGMAATFSHLGCYGIGAGSGSEHRTAEELGWNQWADRETGQFFGDTIHLDDTRPESASESPMLLTVCAASGNLTDVEQRIRKFPSAVAEDMEAFSVAMACRMAHTPLTVIRGISNMAGDRDKSHWDVPAALEAAAKLTIARIRK
jgi:futalosine hydrolase